MCEDDDHLAWKCPISSEACRELCTIGRLIRASDQLDQRSDQRYMNPHIVIIDQFVAAMASIQEAIASLGQRIDGYQTEVAPPPVTMPTLTSKDPHARMDRLELDQHDYEELADFGSMVQALYGIEEGIARGLWFESSPSDSNGKKPLGEQRSGYVGVIGSVGLRPPRHYQIVGQTSGLYYLPSPRHREVFCFIFYQRATMLCSTAVFIVGYVVEPSFSEAHRGWGPGHEIDRCTALRHTIQDLIDQGLVHLGQPSVTTNPLPTHTTHAVLFPAEGIHSINLAELDDHVHMLSWDESEPKPIVSDQIYELGRVTSLRRHQYRHHCRVIDFPTLSHSSIIDLDSG
ncbi:hypothetical protein AAG906_041226 [Vitis piasezkii]